MAAEHRRVTADSPANAMALAQNLAKQGFTIAEQTAGEWLLRKARRRGDITVTITIRRGEQAGQPLSTPPNAVPPSPWGPPPGQRAG